MEEVFSVSKVDSYTSRGLYTVGLIIGILLYSGLPLVQESVLERIGVGSES